MYTRGEFRTPADDDFTVEGRYDTRRACDSTFPRYNKGYKKEREERRIPNRRKRVAVRRTFRISVIPPPSTWAEAEYHCTRRSLCFDVLHDRHSNHVCFENRDFNNAHARARAYGVLDRADLERDRLSRRIRVARDRIEERT